MMTRLPFLPTLAVLATACTFHLQALEITFNNQAGVDPSQIWIQFQGVSGNQVSYGSNSLTFDPNTSFLTEGISLANLTSNYNGTFTVDSLNGSFFISVGSAALPLQVAAPAFIGGAASTTPFQKIELTHASSNASSGGDAEAINYFSIPLGITSYNGSGSSRTVLQNKQWTMNTAQVVNKITQITDYGPSFYVATGGTDSKIVRYLGPSSYPPPPGLPALPYPSWNGYLSQIHTNNQPTTLVNSSGFNVFNGVIVPGAQPGSTNYNFQFNMVMTVDANNNITATGTITTTIIPYGSGSSAGPTFTNVVITLPNNATDFNYALYGSIFPTGTTFNSGTYNSSNPTQQGWGAFIEYLNTVPGLNVPSTGAGAVLSNQIAGEISSGLIMGFVDSSTLSSDGITAYKDLPSNQWWTQYISSETLQPDNEFYNEWSAIIANASGNQIYSNPYSDRFADPANPTIASLTYNSTSVDGWEITIGVPVSELSGDSVPEPQTWTFLIAGGIGMIFMVRRKRSSR